MSFQSLNKFYKEQAEKKVNRNQQMPFRPVLSQKYCEQILEPLTPVQSRVFLCYATYCKYNTGEAIFSVRRLAKKCKANKDTVVKARNDLVRMGWLEKTKRASKCFYYKVLKIKIVC